MVPQHILINVIKTKQTYAKCKDMIFLYEYNLKRKGKKNIFLEKCEIEKLRACQRK